MSNTSLIFSATVVTLPSAGVAIPARLTTAVPTNAQCDLIPLSCDENEDTRNVRNQHKTPQKDSY